MTIDAASPGLTSMFDPLGYLEARSILLRDPATRYRLRDWIAQAADADPADALADAQVLIELAKLRLRDVLDIDKRLDALAASAVFKQAGDPRQWSSGTQAVYLLPLRSFERRQQRCRCDRDGQRSWCARMTCLYKFADVRLRVWSTRNLADFMALDPHGRDLARDNADRLRSNHGTGNQG